VTELAYADAMDWALLVAVGAATGMAAYVAARRHWLAGVGVALAIVIFARVLGADYNDEKPIQPDDAAGFILLFVGAPCAGAGPWSVH
jgi:hypothetical protein